MNGRLSQIRIYPVKGMRASDLVESNIESRGLTGDRRFVTFDSEGVFLSQRKNPELARIAAQWIHDFLKLEDETGERIEVRIEGVRKQIKIWNDWVDAVDCGDEVASWLESRIKTPCRLAAMDEQSHRQVNQDFAQESDEVSFADGFPILLTNTASLADLNNRLESPITMDRFRPNMVVDGFEAWAEDDWKTIRIGEAELRVVKPCGRCIVTTTDQTTGERMGQEPLRTLATFRLIDGKVMFGQNVIPNAPAIVRLGDSIEVLEARS